MKDFFSMIVMVAIIAIATINKWLPFILNIGDRLSNSGFSWSAFFIAFSIGAVITVFAATSKADDVDDDGNKLGPPIDYSVPRFVDVKIIR